MQYTTFGNTGLIASRMTCGAMTFGQGTLVGEWKTDINQNADFAAAKQSRPAAYRIAIF